MNKRLLVKWIFVSLATLGSGSVFATSCSSLTQAMKEQAQQASARGDAEGALEFAAMTGDVAGVRATADNIKRRDASNTGGDAAQKVLNKALYDAAMTGHVSTIQALSEAGASVKAADAPPLIGAAECGQIESMRTLVTLGADVSQRAEIEPQANVPSTPLETALGGGEFKAASWLLSKGADTCSAQTRSRLSRFIQSASVRKGLSTEDFNKLQCKSALPMKAMKPVSLRSTWALFPWFRPKVIDLSHGNMIERV